MGFFTKDIKTLDDLFVHTLRDIYYAEQQIAKNLPDMIEKATDRPSRTALRPTSPKLRTRSSALRSLPDARRRSQGRRLPGHRRHPGGSERGRRRR